MYKGLESQLDLKNKNSIKSILSHNILELSPETGQKLLKNCQIGLK